MKKTFLLLAITLFIGGISFQSCIKEGCTDSDAINYDEYATDDDGSCIYEGEGIFWTDQDYGFDGIKVYVEGTYVGSITMYSSSTPDCGESGFVTITRETGDYSFSAESTDGTTTWSGEITINKNSCSKMRLYVSKSGNTETSFSLYGNPSKELEVAPLTAIK